MLFLNILKKGKAKKLMIEDLLKPFSTNHSIREAVISVFLVNPLIKPERFQELFESGFSPDFHLYQNLGSLQIQIKQGNASIVQQNAQNLGSTGFQFIGFEKGKISRILQGMNQGLNDGTRTFISYHSFSYTRWKEYLNEYLKFIKLLSSFQNDLFINAISIHYVDQFKWISDSPIDLSKVFNDKTRYMSKAFLASTGPTNFIFTTQKNQDNFLYVDRLEIKIDDQKSNDISISHNITKQLDDIKNLNLLLNNDSSYFNDLLLELHQYNKQILGDILNPEVKDLIKLPAEK